MLWVPFALSWALSRVDPVCARTTLRLWHELHVSKGIAHDWEDLLSPWGDGHYLAGVNHGEIRAIGVCMHTERGVRLCKLAHAPEQLDAPRMLMELLHAEGVTPQWKSLRRQPRWCFEALYLREDW